MASCGIENPKRPVAGAGCPSKSSRDRRSREGVSEKGIDPEERFNRVSKQESSLTFMEQAQCWLERAKVRKRKPVANATIASWEGILNNWLYPLIGDLFLANINNAALRRVVLKMSEAGLSPKTIETYSQVVKMVVASAVDEEGEEIHPRKWNHDFIDMPVVERSKQNTPSFNSDVMSQLATWKNLRERMVFILCGASGLRIGEALGLEIDKHVSRDFLTLSIEQKVRNSKVELRVKTASAVRKIDLHPTIAALLKEFAGGREVGFLFCTRSGKPLASTNILRRHLHPALKQLNFINSATGTHKAGNHAFRRFRNTYLRNHTQCPDGLRNYWMGHADRNMDDLYDKIKEDASFRRNWAEKAGCGFALPVVVLNEREFKGEPDIEDAA